MDEKDIKVLKSFPRKIMVENEICLITPRIRRTMFSKVKTTGKKKKKHNKKQKRYLKYPITSMYIFA